MSNNKQPQSSAGHRMLGTVVLVAVVAILATLLTPVVGGTPLAFAADESNQYELVLQDDEYFFVVDAAANTKTWAGHCADQLGTARAVGWDDVKDLQETDTPSCDVLADMLGSAVIPVANQLPDTPVAEADTPPVATASGEYELVLQDDEYFFVVDAAANTKTWAGHCADQLGTARAVGWDDVKDLQETDTPSCDVLADMLGSAVIPVANQLPDTPVAETDAPEETDTPEETEAPEDNAAPTEQRRIVVSMGDSFIAGQSGHLIGNNSAENRGLGIYETTNGCRRSDVAPIRSASIPGVAAENIACAGAVTSDIGRASQSRNTVGRHGEALQIHQLQDLVADNDIETVFVSIGGNDAGFEQFTTTCGLAYAADSNCENTTAAPFVARVQNDMAANVRSTLREIRTVLNDAGQPDARIVLVSYPSPVPAETYYDTLQRLNHGCTFKASDMRYVRTSFVPLMDETLERVANATGVDFLSLSDAFDGKELCSPSTTSRDETGNHAELEWATGVRIAGQTATPESMHPNALGQEALGRCLQLVAASNNSYNKCYNNGGGPSDMRLGGRNEVTFEAPATTTPDCVDPNSDPDGDGWGWENGQTCLVTLDDVTCDVGSEGLAERVCKLLLSNINEDLDNADLGFDSSGLLFTYHDPADRKISGSCSNRLYVTDQKATGVVSSRTDISLESGSLDDPIVLSANVPFSMDLDARFKSEQNYRFFGGCNHISSDRYNVRGTASGNATLTALFDLGTEINPLPNGDVEISIAPNIIVGVELNDPDIDNLRTSGLNPVAQAIGAAGSIISGSTDLTEWIFGGESLRDILKDRGAELLPNVVFTTITPITAPIYEDVAEFVIEEEDGPYEVTAEQELEAAITEALGLDTNGTKTWVVPGELAQLLRNGATIEDVLSL